MSAWGRTVFGSTLLALSACSVLATTDDLTHPGADVDDRSVLSAPIDAAGSEDVARPETDVDPDVDASSGTDAPSIDVSTPDVLANVTDALTPTDDAPPDDVIQPDTNVAVDAGPTGPCNETDLVGSWSFDEGTGVELHDCSAAANNGVLIGAAWNSSGKHGGAGHFDGSGWVSVPNTPSLQLTSALTVSAFVWIAELPDGGGPVSAAYIVGKTASPEISGWRIAVEQSGRISFVASTTGAIAETYSGVLSTGGWIHVAATFQSGTAALFINGVQVDSNFTGPSTTIVNSSMELRFGSRADSTQRLRGDLDDIRLYQRALSPSEITALASQ
jgi:hypothetical protein